MVFNSVEFRSEYVHTYFHYVQNNYLDGFNPKRGVCPFYISALINQRTQGNEIRICWWTVIFQPLILKRNCMVVILQIAVKNYY